MLRVRIRLQNELTLASGSASDGCCRWQSSNLAAGSVWPAWSSTRNLSLHTFDFPSPSFSKIRPRWSMLHSLTVTGPTAAIAFCPAEYGLILAAAGSEGRDIWFFTGKDGGRDCRGITETLAAAPGGLVALSWAPAASPSTLAAGPAAKSASKAPRRLVSAAARSVRIWRHEETWSMREELIQGPGPAVRDVAWRPNLGIPSSSVAMCFEDGLVQIWSQDMEGQAWNIQVSWSVNDEAWRLAWSKAGCMLAVSYGMNSCQLFKEGLVSEWKEVCNLDGEWTVASKACSC